MHIELPDWALLGAVTTAVGLGVAKLLLSARSKAAAPDTLYYYFNANFTGRVEGPMLLLEDVGAPYTCSSAVNEPKEANPACFAPPFLKDGETFMSQSTAICFHLGIKHGVAGAPEKAGLMMRALGNAEDFWGEAYRPTKGGKDKEAGAAYATGERFTKWLVVLQGPLTSGGDYLFGSAPTSVDYHLLATLRAAQEMYPKAFGANLKDPQLSKLSQWMERMVARPKIAAFLKSDRCLPVLYPGVQGIA